MFDRSSGIGRLAEKALRPHVRKPPVKVEILSSIAGEDFVEATDRLRVPGAHDAAAAMGVP